MANPTDIEVRLFDKTGARKAFNPDTLLKVSWELLDAGGCSQITIDVAQAFDAPLAIPGDIVEVWVLGESVPRARAIVNTPEPSLDLAEKHDIVAYGRMEDMQQVFVDQIVVVPGGADLSYFAAIFASCYSQARVGSWFGRSANDGDIAPSFVTDLQSVNVSLERLDASNTNIRAVFDGFKDQAASNAVWGWDIEPVSGLWRLFLRPRVAKVGSQFFVGGNVKLLTSPAELQQLKNAGKISGGPARYPQLAYNPSFYLPTVPTITSGTLLLNGGFEDGTGGPFDPIEDWNPVGSPSRDSANDRGYHVWSPHSGSYYVLLDSDGEEINQWVYGVDGTKTYNASIFAAATENQINGIDFNPDVELIVEGWNAAGDFVTSVTTQPVPLTSTIWTGGQPSTVLASDGSIVLTVAFADPTIVTFKFRVVARLDSSVTGTNAGHGVLIDDCVLYESDANGQDGWQTGEDVPGDSRNRFLSIDWINKDAAVDGVYGVRASVVAQTGYKPWIVNTPGGPGGGGHNYQPAVNQLICTSTMVRMAPLLNSAAGVVWLTYREWASDGSQNQAVQQVATIPNDGAWHLVSQVVTAKPTVSSASVQVEFEATGVYDIGYISARDAAAGTDFLRSTNFEKYVLCTDVCTPGTDSYESMATFGLRDGAVIDNDDVIDWGADAQAWAKAYFDLNAVLLRRPRVDLSHEPTQIPTPGNGLQIQVSGTAAADIVDWCSKAGYTWAKMSLAISLDLSSERPTLAKLFKSLGAGGGGSTSSIAAVAAASAGSQTSGGGGTAVIPFSNGTPSALSPTTAASAGTSSEVPRADHIHAISVDEFNIDGGNAFSVYTTSLMISGGGA